MVASFPLLCELCLKIVIVRARDAYTIFTKQPISCQPLLGSKAVTNLFLTLQKYAGDKLFKLDSFSDAIQVFIHIKTQRLRIKIHTMILPPSNNCHQL